MLAKTITPKQRYWLNHVKAADQGGDTIAGYAQSQDISLKSLYQWKTKLIRLNLYDSVTSSDSDFVAVTPAPSEAIRAADPTVNTRQSGCTVTLDNGYRIDFHGELSPGVIRSIMTTVSQAH